MKLTQFISTLKLLQSEFSKQNPDSPDVLLSLDEEGNSLGEIDVNISFGYDKKSNSLIIYPINSVPDL